MHIVLKFYFQKRDSGFSDSLTSPTYHANVTVGSTTKSGDCTDHAKSLAHSDGNAPKYANAKAEEGTKAAAVDNNCTPDSSNKAAGDGGGTAAVLEKELLEMRAQCEQLHQQLKARDEDFSLLAMQNKTVRFYCCAIRTYHSDEILLLCNSYLNTTVRYWCVIPAEFLDV